MQKAASLVLLSLPESHIEFDTMSQLEQASRETYIFLIKRF